MEPITPRIDNDRLSDPLETRVIPPSEWKRLRWDEFENLARAFFAEVLRGATWAHFEPPRKGPDGGRDLEVRIETPIGTTTIWVECKHHAKALGLETLGKYLVLIIVKRVQHLYIVSSSEVTENAQAEFTFAVERQGLKVHFLDGIRFETAIARRPRLLQQYFPAVAASARSAEGNSPISARVRITEYENATVEDMLADTIVRPRRPHFYIYLLVRNDSSEAIPIEVVPPAEDKDASVMRDPASPPLTRTLDPYESTTIRLCCTASQRSGELRLHPIVIRHGQDRSASATVPLPPVNLDALRVAPLTGASARRILDSFEESFLPAVAARQPPILYLSGGSGTGKTRLIEEITARARPSGILPVESDAASMRRDDPLRHILTALMNLPLRRGRLVDARDALTELLGQRGATKAHIRDVAAFLTGRAELGSVDYALLETFRSLIIEPVLQVPFIVLIDNIQQLSARGLELLFDVAEFLSHTASPLGLVLSENTEVVPRQLLSPMAAARQRRDALEARKILRHESVEPLDDHEAKRLMFALLRGRTTLDAPDETVKAEAPLLEVLIKKVGTRPFDIVMTAEWLRDRRIITPTRDDDWIPGEFAKFQEFVRGVPSKPAQIIARRLETIRTNAGASTWRRMEKALRALVAFSGRLPLSFLGASDSSAVSELVARAILRYDRDGVATVLPFHDNIRIFLEKESSFAVPPPLAERVLRWIDRTERHHLHEWTLVRFRNAVRARRPAEETIAIGETIAGLDGSAGAGPLELIDVGRTLTRVMDGAKLAARDLARYLTIRSCYADALLNAADLAAGLSEYESLHELVNVHHLVSENDENRFHHRLIKAHIGSERYTRALELIDIRARRPPVDAIFRFLLDDRRAIVCIAFGDVPAARNAMASAFRIATEIEDGMWESIACSDRALISLHSTFHRAEATRDLREAVTVYRDRASKESWRDLEIVHHEALIALLEGDPVIASKHATYALKLSEERHNALYAATTYDLLALAAAAAGDVARCRQALIALRAKSLATYNTRGLRRAHTNLAVLDIAERNDRGARANLNAAIESVIASPAAREGAVMHLLPAVIVDYIHRRHGGASEPAEALRTLWAHPVIADRLRRLDAEPPHRFAGVLAAHPCSLFTFYGLPLSFG